MKRIRLIVLTAVVLSALLAAVIPALAAPPILYQMNFNFEQDVNGDNIPDRWKVAGDAYRLCDSSYLPGNCIMVFPPSNKGAAVYQTVPASIIFIVVEEGYSAYIGEAGVAGLHLPLDRAYYGIRLNFEDGTTITLYDNVANAKTFNWQANVYFDNVGWSAANNYIPTATFGILVLPGDGYLGVDFIAPPLS